MAITQRGNAQSIISWKFNNKWKFVSLSLRPYIQFYISHYKADVIIFHFALFGYPFKALIGIDTAHGSKLYPIHSLFWFRFTKIVSGEANGKKR